METKEIIKISATSLVMGVLISFVFPEGSNIKMPWPMPFNFILEIFYYALIISLFDNSTGFNEHLFYAGGSFIFRIMTSLVFAAAITSAGEVSFSTAIRLGIVDYLPQVYSAILIAPWILLSFMKDSYRDQIHGADRIEEVAVPPVKRSFTDLSPAVEQPRQTGRAIDGTLSIETALDYIKEYSGVIGCILASKDGLVIDYRFRSREAAEDRAAQLAELFKTNRRMLNGVNTDSLSQIEFISEGVRIGLYDVSDNILIVISDSTADNLLGIRVSRSFEMLKIVFQKRYEATVTSGI